MTGGFKKKVKQTPTLGPKYQANFIAEREHSYLISSPVS